MTCPVLTADQILACRLRAHHLDRPAPLESLAAVAGETGVQNSPPGAWETAIFQRVPGATPALLRRELEQRRTLLQAWSFRGAPFVFPASDARVFLDALIPREGEEWIYTRGIPALLERLGMPLEPLLALTAKAARTLEGRIVRAKRALDEDLAGRVAPLLEGRRRAVWASPSLLAEGQTLGEAAVSFLLRPCALLRLVVFGPREGAFPSFTGFSSWTGLPARPEPGGEAELVRRLVHAFGPAYPGALEELLGCSPAQARRLWNAAAPQLVPVTVEGAKGAKRYVLAQDLEAFERAERPLPRLLLLGPHDPYLDLRDRALILPDPNRRREVWRTVGNPGVILSGGRIAGIWRARRSGGAAAFSVRLWSGPAPGNGSEVEKLAQALAAFWGLRYGGCEWET